MNMPLVLLNRRRRGFTAFSPSTLFALAEPGVWFDPSDLTTLFQDPEGTTPVTAPGNTVGLMLDKSKGLVLGPELVTNGDFASGTGWTLKTGATISGGVLSINATGDIFDIAGQTNILTRFKWYRVTATCSSYTSGIAFVALGDAGLGSRIAVTGAGTFTGLIYHNSLVQDIDIRAFGAGGTGPTVLTLDSVSIKELPGNHATQATLAARPTYSIEPVGGRRNLLLATDTLATQSLTVAAVAHTLAFTGTGTVTLTGASIAGPLIGTGASNRVSLTFTPTAASLTLTVVGSVTLAQLELGSTATAYQRVTTQHDVTEAGVASLGYLYFDGVNDSMATSTITPGTDKAQVFAGVRYNVYGANAVVYGLSTDFVSTAGTFGLRASTSSTLQFLLRGSVDVSNSPATIPTMPSTFITSHLMDIAAATGAENALRVNGGAAVFAPNNAGAGNFSNQPLYLGSFAGSGSYLNGHLYSLITRFGPTLDAPTITSTETWVAGKTGITI